MPDLPSFAMRVSDVSESLAFLVEKLGFTLTEHQPDADIAYLLADDGDSLLLAGPAAQDLDSYLVVQHLILKPGESLDFTDRNLEVWAADLLRKGGTDFRIKQSRIGDRMLVLRVFDDYTFRYIETITRTFEELLNLYDGAPAELDEALAGLSEADTRLALSENSWSIRQIVHHLADCDILFSETMKVQLSSPGAVMEDPREVGNERVSAEPEYRNRPVATSVALFRAFHEHILDIVKYVPDAGERYIEVRDGHGHKHTFSQMVHLIVGHTAEHLDEIWEIRHKYGK
ncbi:MAG TPA: DinB family protein [Ktedonobacteraceae bacterium]